MHIGKEAFYEYLLLKPQQAINETLRQYGMELNYSTSEPEKVKLHFETLLQNIYRRHVLKVYKGILPYIQQLQRLLEFYSSSDKRNSDFYQQTIHSVTGVYVSANTNSILVQCNQCGKHTTPEPYNCMTCQSAFYCSHGCKVNHKYTHEQQQCHQRMYPKIPMGIQVEVHLGCDLGQNLQIHFQHQSRMSFKLKGKEFMTKLGFILSSSRQLKKDMYEVQQTKDYSHIKIIKDKHQHTPGEEISLKTFEEVCLIYLLDPALYYIRLVLLRQGALLKDTIKEIYNSHVHIVLVFNCPI